MIIKDKIFNKIVIDDEFIIDLINTKSFKRLKGVTQSGIPEVWNIYSSYSRYVHSIGVYYLLNYFGATKREQIAGLLHDLSHRSFSHLYEWVVDDTQSSKEDLVESDLDNFLQTRDILEVFEKHGVEPLKKIEFQEFKMLDQDVPDLCIDRIEYSFREYFAFHQKNTLYEQCFSRDQEGTVQKLLKCREKQSITSTQNVLSCIKYDNIINKFYFTDEQVAYFYANSFLELQVIVWGSKNSTFRYETMKLLFRAAIKHKIIKLSDFVKSEKYIIEKIHKSIDNREIKLFLGLLEKNCIPDTPYYNVNRYKKFRYVNPLVKTHKMDEYVRVSDLSAEFKADIAKYEKENSLGDVI